jgi:hypothetical protein
MCWTGSLDLRERKVAEQHLDYVDNSQREHLLRNLHVKLEQAASCDTARAMRQPASNGAQDVLLVSATIGPALRAGGEGRRDGGAQSHPAEGTIEGAREGRDADEEDVRDDELHVRGSEREGESAGLACIVYLHS